MKPFATSLVLFAFAGVSTWAAISCRPAEAPPSASEGDAAPALAADSGTATEEGDARAATETPAAADGGSVALAPVLVTGAAEVQKIFDAAHASPKATAKPGGAAGAGPVAKEIRELAKAAAPGMKADGPLFVAKLDEKKEAHAEITLKPGHCYTVLGYSEKITDLDLYLLLPPGILSGQDATDDNKPTIGKAPDAMCPTGKSSIKYLLGIVADQGAGEAAVQLYSKSAKKPK
jgi:hypothetical protein